MSAVRFLTAGDSAVCVEFGDAISPEINSRIRSFSLALKASPIKGVTDIIPAYCSVLVCYNPAVISYESIIKKLKFKLLKPAKVDNPAGRIFLIPVCYGGEFGEDLKTVAEFTGLSEEEVIRCHSSTDYLIYMLGFLPGFAYLGGMDKQLITPRLDNPRTSIPAGSVGIGGEQTGIYPLASPGGWRIIGRTPVKPFDPNREPPILYTAGDTIRFVPIDKAEYDRVEALSAKGEYNCEALKRGNE